MFKRILLKCVDGAEEDRVPIMLDAPVVGRKILGSAILFGSWGYPSSDPGHVYPFILERTGRLDFGSYDENEGRFGELNLRSAEIVEGALITAEDWEGNAYSFRIMSVTNIVENT